MRSVLLPGLALLAACTGPQGQPVEDVTRTEKPEALADLETEEERTAHAQAEAKSAETRLAAARENKVKRLMEGSLFDPFSARFRHVRHVRDGRGGVICGQVNAKNRYGAYTGFTDFVASGRNGGVWMSEGNDGIASDTSSSFAIAYAGACANSRERRAFAQANAPEPAVEDELAFTPPVIDAAPEPAAGAAGDFEAAERDPFGGDEPAANVAEADIYR